MILTSKKAFLTMLLSGLIVISSAVQADENSKFDPPLAPPLLPSRQGMRAYSEVFKSVAVNSINTTTPGYRSMKGNIVNHGGEVSVEVYRASDKGAAVETRRPLDLIVEGTGFFVAQLPFGIAYTRDGRMDVSPTGTLVTLVGRYPVLSKEMTPIQLSTSKVIITQRGTILQDEQVVGTIGVVGFMKKAPLQSIGGIFFYLPDSERDKYEEVPMYTVKQGFYEDSNVSLSDEMVKIPVFKDEHDANSKAAKTVLKSLQTAASLGRSN